MNSKIHTRVAPARLMSQSQAEDRPATFLEILNEGAKLVGLIAVCAAFLFLASVIFSTPADAAEAVTIEPWQIDTVSRVFMWFIGLWSGVLLAVGYIVLIRGAGK